MIEDMIAAEKEADPDALDEDVRTKVNKQIALKKMGGADLESNTTTTTDVRKSKQPAIALGTVLATNI